LFSKAGELRRLAPSKKILAQYQLAVITPKAIYNYGLGGIDIYFGL